MSAIHVTLQYFGCSLQQFLALEIQKLFPKEEISTYFFAYSNGPAGKCQKGRKLYNTFQHYRTTYYNPTWKENEKETKKLPTGFGLVGPLGMYFTVPT